MEAKFLPLFFFFVFGKCEVNTGHSCYQKRYLRTVTELNLLELLRWLVEADPELETMKQSDLHSRSFSNLCHSPGPHQM